MISAWFSLLKSIIVQVMDCQKHYGGTSKEGNIITEAYEDLRVRLPLAITFLAKLLPY